MSKQKTKSVAEITAPYRARVTEKGSDKARTDQLSTFFAYNDMGLHKLAASVATGEEIDVNDVFPIIEKFIFYYCQENPEARKSIDDVVDHLIEAEQHAGKHNYGSMLANILLIWATINDPALEKKVKKELRKGQSKGGQASHWRQYEQVLIKHLKLYGDRKYKNKEQAISAIETEIGSKGPSIDTFNFWWKKYKQGRPLYPPKN